MKKEKNILFIVIIFTLVVTSNILFPRNIKAKGKKYWTINTKDSKKLPNNFRFMTDKWKKETKDIVSRDGLKKLRVSASSNPTYSSFKKIKSKIRKKSGKHCKIYILDLRQEYHGFANKYSVTRTNKDNNANFGYSTIRVVNKEKRCLKTLIKKKAAFYQGRRGKTKKLIKKIKKVRTEAEVAKKHGFKYKRIVMTDRQWPEDEETIDKIIAWYRSLSKNSWLHIHCMQGEGRTGIVLSMIDMMENPDLSCETILKRQYLLGASDLYTIDKSHQKKYKCAMQIRKFYDYVQSQKDNDYEIKWSQWIKTN